MHTHDAPAKTDMFVSRQAPARGNGVDDGQQDVAITWCRYKQFLSFTKQNTENTRQQDNRTGTRLGLEAVPPLHAHNQSDTNKSRESKKIGTERLRKVLRAAGVASIRGADALRSQNLVIVTSKKRELWADAGPWGSTTSYESWYQQGYCFCGYPDAITGAVADALIWMESEEVFFDNMSWGDRGKCK